MVLRVAAFLVAACVLAAGEDRRPPPDTRPHIGGKPDPDRKPTEYAKVKCRSIGKNEMPPEVHKKCVAIQKERRASQVVLEKMARSEFETFPRPRLLHFLEESDDPSRRRFALAEHALKQTYAKILYVEADLAVSLEDFENEASLRRSADVMARPEQTEEQQQALLERAERHGLPVDEYLKHEAALMTHARKVRKERAKALEKGTALR